jgi:hypothetical protein
MRKSASAVNIAPVNDSLNNEEEEEEENENLIDQNVNILIIDLVG